MSAPDDVRSIPLMVGLLVLMLTILGELSTQLYVPALSLIAGEMSASPVAVQSSLWLFLFAFGVGQLVFGPASDRLGRRPVLLSGLGLYVAATVGCLLAESVTVLIIARVLQALGACVGFVMARAIIRDVYPLPRVPAVLATTTLAIALSVAIAPTIGGWVSMQWGWRMIFAALAVLGVLLALLVAVGLPETRPKNGTGVERTESLLRAYREVAMHPVFLRHALPLGLVYGAMMAYVVGAPFAVRNMLGVSTETLGLIFGGILSGFVIALVLSRLLVRRVGPQRLLTAGLALVCLFALTTAVGYALRGLDAYSVVLPQFLLTLGAGFVFPNAVAGAIAPHGSRAGMAAALVGCLQMLLGALCGLLVSAAGTSSTAPMLLIQLIVVIAAVAANRLFSARRAALADAVL
ncbi:multidrug effflux MFS transporter [Marinobacter lacisalsi]|uniref:Bcr/CflA family efflux transporter n=1 Tax=Marinobacter lacisalsi TaxID=475979 RepID=A0ABV8QE28_9GAMM